MNWVATACFRGDNQDTTENRTLVNACLPNQYLWYISKNICTKCKLALKSRILLHMYLCIKKLKLINTDIFFLVLLCIHCIAEYFSVHYLIYDESFPDFLALPYINCIKYMYFFAMKQLHLTFFISSLYTRSLVKHLSTYIGKKRIKWKRKLRNCNKKK